VQAVTEEDVLAVNSRDQQTQVDAIMQDRIQRGLLEAGVTIVSAINTYVEAGVAIGADTVIRPFTFIGHDARIGSDCIIGPFAQLPPGSLVPDRSVIRNNVGSESLDRN